MQPGFVEAADILGAVNRFVLPKATADDRGRARGLELEPYAPPIVSSPLTEMGRSAAQRFNELPGPVPIRHETYDA